MFDLNPQRYHRHLNSFLFACEAPGLIPDRAFLGHFFGSTFLGMFSTPHEQRLCLGCTSYLEQPGASKIRPGTAKNKQEKYKTLVFWVVFCNGMYLISDAYIANWVALQVSAGQHHFNLCTWCCRATQSNIEASLINLHTWFKNMLEWVACKIQQGHSAPMQTAELPSLT